MAAIWEMPNLSPTEKLVLLAVADCASDEGFAWPSVATLARKTGCGERTVQRSLRAAEQSGLLVADGYHGKTVRYRLDPRHSGTPASVAPRQTGTPTPATVAPHPRHSGTQSIIEPSLNHQEGSSPDSDPPISIGEVVEAWNDTAGKFGLRRCSKLTEDRRKRLRSLIHKYPMDDFRTALAAVARSQFCRGENERGWTADIDFFSREKNFVRLVEGSFDGKSSRSAGQWV